MNGTAWHTVKTLSAQVLFAILIIGKSISKQPTAMLINAPWTDEETTWSFQDH